MIKKIKAIINENRLNQKNILLQSKELEWAHVYHDSIRGKQWLLDLPLNIGRWAGNYSFFYVLNRILSDYKPNKILELGLGESSKFVSTYLENYLFDSSHTIIEQDENWKNSFETSFKLSSRSKILHCSLQEKEIKGFKTKVYNGLDNKINENFDLYIVDGPHGSERYSRYDIVSLVSNLDEKNQFIIIIDDTERQGEKDTVADIKELLKTKSISYYQGDYIGNKCVTLIVSEKYKYSISM
ncbi:hypothetical protein MCEGE10_01640 [Flavobacteriaceae bacterium]